jgi:flagella basal body P-ring formation protein FlgA
VENFGARIRRRVTMGAVQACDREEPMSDVSPRARRRFAVDVRLVLGLALVAASVAAVTVLVGVADSRVAVYAAADALAPGDRVDADDLVERSVALDGSEDLYLLVASTPADGFVVTQPVAAGQLVPLSAAGSLDGARATSLVLQLTGPVSTVVETGTLVDVWGVAALEQGEFGTPVVLASQATVVRVLEDETLIAGSGGGASTVEVLVPRTRVARLLQAIANGDALAAVPSGLPLGSP